MNACLDRRDAIHRLLDDELDSAERAAFDAHLGSCAGCREMLAGLEATRAVLRALPKEMLPAEALDTVWARTIRSAETGRAAARAPWWWAAAAAATVTVAILGGLLRAPRLPSADRAVADAVTAPADIDRAGREARFVLALTSRALHKSGSAARDQVLGGRVAPALRRIPIRWAEEPTSDPGKRGT